LPEGKGPPSVGIPPCEEECGADGASMGPKRGPAANAGCSSVSLIPLSWHWSSGQQIENMVPSLGNSRSVSTMNGLEVIGRISKPALLKCA